jgi:arsenite-transporting ATPase
VFFAGKGGVGKTTCASACALDALRRDTARQILLVSTDPAHSLGDALGLKLSGAPRLVRPGLDAVELDAPRAFARWLDANHRALREIFEQGTWLDRDDVESLLGLSIPGVDELAGILEIARLAGERNDRRRRKEELALRSSRSSRSKTYDTVIVDTAPTGHTLRLLTAPDTVSTVAEVLDGLREEHRFIRDRLARVGGRPEAADRLIEELARQARETAARLRDRRRTTVHWVTLPEELSRAESEDGIGALERGGLAVPEIIVNRVLPDGSACRVCDRRRASERRVIAEIQRTIAGGRRLRLIAAEAKEPRGLAALAALARVMADGKRPIARSAVTNHQPSAISDQPSRGAVPGAMAEFRGASLLFFGGKGGVGKTTVAAAAALRLAAVDPQRRVLLISTDPAHSLADVFQEAVGDAARPIAGGPRNLDVRELDAARAFAERREQLEEAFDDIASALGASAGSHELMGLTPPGIDELFGMLSVVDARAAYDVVIVDTAPTGHALRLLEMPGAAREWTQLLMRVLLKYKSLVRPGRLAADLVDLSKSIRELQALMRDASRTRVIVVARAADVPRRETARLLGRLRRLHLSVPAIVVNALTLAPGTCAWCRTTATAERREIGGLRRVCGRRCAIIQAPLSAPPPRGVDALTAWGRTFIA